MNKETGEAMKKGLTGAKIIICRACHEPCGKLYPATEIDPAYTEGVGENFLMGGYWHCSQFCADVTKGIYDGE